MTKEIFVVVADNDKYHEMPNTGFPYYNYNGPLVFETYVQNASIEDAKKSSLPDLAESTVNVGLLNLTL